jgi:hypothetical protein
MFSGADALLLTLLVWGLIMLVLYWVIRLAVRHALEDAAGRRTADYSPVPTRPAGRRPGPPSAD